MKTIQTAGVGRDEILCALDYLDYLDKRLEYAEDTWWEVCDRIKKLQAWLERVAEKVDVKADDKAI